MLTYFVSLVAINVDQIFHNAFYYQLESNLPNLPEEKVKDIWLKEFYRNYSKDNGWSNHQVIVLKMLGDQP